MKKEALRMNNVLKLRSDLNMTQDEFAEHCDVSRISIARYETGGKVSRASAEKIAAACGVSVSFVIGDTKKEPAEAGALNELLIRELMDLSPAEVELLRAFLAGMKAKRKA
jgi:transcriptional regulator with XRE-family HTH domain